MSEILRLTSAFFDALKENSTQGLTVARIPEPSTAAEIPALMERHSVVFHPLRELNWKDIYPYRPDVQFAVTHCETAVLLHFRVLERGTSALTHQDHGPVWNDSCVEFFVMPEWADACYFNVECNCIGALHLAAGTDRHARRYAPSEIMRRIERWTSLSPDIFSGDSMPGNQEVLSWELALKIPTDCLNAWNEAEENNGKTLPWCKLSGRRMKANFYKCGGTGSCKHYLSWAPIQSERPDFHRPEFFEDLRFE